MSYTTRVTYSFALKIILQQMTRMILQYQTIHCLEPSFIFGSRIFGATTSERDATHRQEDHKTPNSLLDETAFLHLLVAKEGEPPYVPLSTNLGLKFKRRMLYFPMDFGELTLDGLIDTGAHSSAIPEADLRKIRLLAPQSIVKEGPAQSFQIMVANGDLETPKSTVELKFEVGDIEFHEIFIVMGKFSSP